MKKLPLFLFIGAIGLVIYFMVYSDGGNIKIKTGESQKTETKRIKKDKEAPTPSVQKIHAFDKIKVDGHFEVIVHYGTREKVEIEYSNGTRQEIKLNVESSTLLVKLDRNIALQYRNGSKIHVYTEKLNGFELGGTASVTLDNTLKDNSFSIQSGGAAKFKGQVEVEESEIELNGAASMELAGSASNTRLNLAGASNLTAYDFEVNKFTVDMNGLSKAKITCLKALEGKLSGISKLSYDGNPGVNTVKTSGSSTLKAR